MAVLTPVAKMQFLDATGAPLVGGLLYTYAAGTTTPQASYIDATGATPNTNPVVLDSRGEANIWLGAATYKFRLCAADNTELWTVDDISAPTSALSPVLSGNVTISSSSSGSALTITQAGTGAIIKVPNSTNPAVTLYTVDNTGHVGIGTASPANALDVAGGTIQISSSSGTAYATLAADASNSTLSSVGARGLILNANSINLIYGTSSGFVGIKNASPTVELDVTGAIKTSGAATIGGNTAVTGTLSATGNISSSAGSLSANTTLTVGTSASIGTTLAVDTINGKTTSTDVTVGGVLCSNGVVTASAVRITAGTAKAYNWNGLTTNTFLDFTGIPSWVKRVTIMFTGFRTDNSGGGGAIIQLGTASGIETSSYLGSASSNSNAASPSVTVFTTGILLDGSGSGLSSYLRNGVVTINLLTGNTWAISGTLGNSEATRCTFVGGSKALSTTLDRVRITSGSGTDVLTGGTVNILYE